MFICATANKKNNTDDKRQHIETNFYRRHDDTPPSDKPLTQQTRTKNFHRTASHTLSQIIIFDTSDTQNHKTDLPVFMYHFGTHQHIIFSLYYVQFL